MEHFLTERGLISHKNGSVNAHYLVLGNLFYVDGDSHVNTYHL